MSDNTANEKARIDAALAAAASRRAAAAAMHPGIVAEVGSPPPYNPGAHPDPLAPSYPPPGAVGEGIQTASYEALMREIERRKTLAMQKLRDIPTEFLELELQRRKEAGK